VLPHPALEVPHIGSTRFVDRNYEHLVIEEAAYDGGRRNKCTTRPRRPKSLGFFWAICANNVRLRRGRGLCCAVPCAAERPLNAAGGGGSSCDKESYHIEVPNKANQHDSLKLADEAAVHIRRFRFRTSRTSRTLRTSRTSRTSRTGSGCEYDVDTARSPTLKPPRSFVYRSQIRFSTKIDVALSYMLRKPNNKTRDGNDTSRIKLAPAEIVANSRNPKPRDSPVRSSLQTTKQSRSINQSQKWSDSESESGGK
jgi:hypothetical protein